MSVRDLIGAANASLLSSAADNPVLVETVTYTPKTGDPVTCTAMGTRLGTEQTEGQARAVVDQATARFLISTDDVSDPRIGDRVVATDAEWRVIGILPTTPGMVNVHVAANTNAVRTL